MYLFSLMKSLYFELDKYKMDDVDEWQEGKSTFRRKEVSYPNVPDIQSFTMELRILPYLDRYYMFVNDGRVEVNVRDAQIKQLIYEFYHEHFPDYLKEDIPDDLTGVDILDCFEVFKMPSYRPEYAFPGLVKLDDLRAGKVHDESPLHAYPGLDFVGKYKEEKIRQRPALGGLDMILANRRQRDPDKPTWSDFEGYEEFGGDQNKAISKIEQMKALYAPAMKGFNVDEIIKNSSVADAYAEHDAAYRKHVEEKQKKGEIDLPASDLPEFGEKEESGE